MKGKKLHFKLFTLLFLILGMAACHTPSRNQEMSSDINTIEDSLKNGKFEAAMQMINKHLSETNDSDIYYRWLSVKNIAWHSETNVDSMLSTSEQIHQYLLRNNQQNPIRQLLWAEWYKAQGVYFSAILGKQDSALAYTQKSLSVLDDTPGEDDLKLVARTNMAFFYRLLGQYDKSIESYMLGLELADSLGKIDEARTVLLLGISTAYTYMNDFTRSEYWWNRTSQLLPYMIKADQFCYYNDRGNDYYFQQEYAKARDCFAQAALPTKGDQSKIWDYYTSITNLGEVYVCLEKIDSAKMMLHQADSFFRKMDFSPILYYIETSNIKLEMQEGHADKALDMMLHSKIEYPKLPSAKVQRLKATKQIMSQTGHYREAYEADQQLDALTDSLQAANISMQFSTRLMEYEHDKRLIEQQKTLEEARADKLTAWIFFIVMLLIAIILIGQFHLYKRRQRFNDLKIRRQIVLMRMENIRNRITPHFIYNALNHEVLAQMEGRDIDLNSLTQLLRRGVEQADILQTTLAEELSFVDYYVGIEGHQMGPDFAYAKEIADDVDTRKVNLPSMSIQIFVENALKHGLRPIKPVEGHLQKLLIRASREKQATLVEVYDNGQGLQIKNDGGTHLGGHVIRQTIQLLNDNNINQITFGINNWQEDEESGCRSWILLPDNYNYQLTQATN